MVSTNEIRDLIRRTNTVYMVRKIDLQTFARFRARTLSSGHEKSAKPWGKTKKHRTVSRYTAFGRKRTSESRINWRMNGLDVKKTAVQESDEQWKEN